jgi:polyisoprenoid-binding protein YceI
MRIFTILPVAALFLAAGSAFTQTTYQIDSTHSSAQFSVRHMMISNVHGQFNKVTGTVIYDANNLAASKVDAVIDTTTVDTQDQKRDGHLKSPDFLDAAKYPTMTFSSKHFTNANGKLQIQGDLTLHGVTKAVVLDVDGPSPEIKDPYGMFRRGVTATTHLNRKDFGLVWNAAVEGGGVVVGDEVAITIELEGVRRPTSTQ